MSPSLAVTDPRYTASDVHRLFESLAAMRIAMSRDSSRAGSVLGDAAFEELTDHLVLTTPAAQFGRHRFEFVGSTVAELGRGGDVSGLSFGDIMIDDLARQALQGYRHIANLRTPHVSTNHAVVSPRAKLFTRLIMPLFLRDKIALVVGAVVFHDEPIALGDIRRHFAPPR